MIFIEVLVNSLVLSGIAMDFFAGSRPNQIKSTYLVVRGITMVLQEIFMEFRLRQILVAVLKLVKNSVDAVVWITCKRFEGSY